MIIKREVFLCIDGGWNGEDRGRDGFGESAGMEDGVDAGSQGTMGDVEVS
jgi:hypothetical protein